MYLLILIFSLLLLQAFLILNILNKEYFIGEYVTYETANISLDNQFYVPNLKEYNNETNVFRDDNIYIY